MSQRDPRYSAEHAPVSLRAQNLTLISNHDDLDNCTELELAKEFEAELSFVLDERSGR